MYARTRNILWALLLAAAAVGMAVAQEKKSEQAPPGKISDMWIIWPKEGHELTFEDAAKQYVAWRKQAGDPFRWRAYQPHAGDDLGYYVFRSEGHDWADFDKLVDWNRSSGNAGKYEELIGPHVKHIEHYYSEADFDHSKWEDRDDYRYYSVVELQLKPGMYGEMSQALGKLHKALTEGNWPRSYGIEWTVGGDGGMVVVYPYTNFAGMADPDPPFIEFLSSQMGSQDEARATMKQLQSAFEDSHETIYIYRPDLSTPE